MNEIMGKVGPYLLKWNIAPRGNQGTTVLTLENGGKLRVSWRKDAHGIWIELPSGVYGFDIRGETQEDGNVIYSLGERNSNREWKNLAFKRAGEEQLSSTLSQKKKSVQVKAQMPGKIVKVLVQPNQSVEKDQPLIVMEAMKMENEIVSPSAGRVSEIKATPGQAVESGASLILISAE